MSDTELEINLSPSEKDYALLGKVLSEWGEVEFWLLVILRSLVGISHNDSLAVFSNIRNYRTITLMLSDLAEEKMNSEDEKKFKRLLGSFNKLARHRNGIVHAGWYKNQKSEWCRYLVPSSHGKIKEVFSPAPSDQKTRAKHLFSPARMEQMCKDTRALQSSIVEFWDDWSYRQNPY
ncbi:MAG: hypothetical protein L3J30_12580 [Marinosulfonomonas sp.]|nr:hypothetical protein [Marinosulfonomonas sp.]